MGYILDPNTSFFLHPGMLQHAGDGSLSHGVETAWYSSISVPAGGPGTFNLKFPILGIPQPDAGFKGIYIRTLDIWYTTESALAATLDAVFYYPLYPDDGEAITAAARSFTYDANHDTNGDRVAAADHKMTLTLDAPFWLSNSRFCYAQFNLVDYFAAGAARNLYFYGLRVNGDFRL